MNRESLNRPQSNGQENLSSRGPIEEGVKINGLEQVIEMLQFADPAFRESLLKRLMQRDPKLASSLRKIIR